ncbi:MAG: hypothetical protein EA393_00550 [Bacteroidetes bacterium]|nr:MAG: hypothetical protein EA393_00550 [Bacteroidota bacterium]
MSLESLILFVILPLVLSMLHFSVSVSNGIGKEALKPGTPLKTSLIFAISTILLLWLGYVVAGMVKGRIEFRDEAVAFIFLAFIGFRMILHAWQKKAQKKIFDINEIPVIFALALVLGINMLFTGVAVRFLDIPAMRFFLIQGAMVLFLSFSGLLYANQFGDKLGWKLELISGILILAMGFRIALV